MDDFYKFDFVYVNLGKSKVDSPFNCNVKLIVYEFPTLINLNDHPVYLAVGLVL